MTQRLRSLDVFRGLTIMLMIIVNSPGNAHPYPFLAHSAWHGCTLADLVFPFFLWIMGVSCALNLFHAQKIHENKKTLIIHIVKRSVVIFALGLLLNAFPTMDIHHLRIPGVLQRIAICYAICAVLYLKTTTQTQMLTILILLLSYPFLIQHVPQAGIDSWLLGDAHLYRPHFDPEGIMSTLPALATTLLGQLTGIALCHMTPPYRKKSVILAFAAGISLAFLGYILGWIDPINKSLWSSSYVLWTAGIALCVYAWCFDIIERQRKVRFCFIFDIFGRNALLAYILHVLFLKIQTHLIIHTDHGDANLKTYLTTHYFGWASTHNAALLYAIAYTGLWLLVLWPLYQRRWFLKL